jgi:hypothetical protein
MNIMPLFSFRGLSSVLAMSMKIWIDCRSSLKINTQQQVDQINTQVQNMQEVSRNTHNLVATTNQILEARNVCLRSFTNEIAINRVAMQAFVDAFLTNITVAGGQMQEMADTIGEFNNIFQNLNEHTATMQESLSTSRSHLYEIQAVGLRVAIFFLLASSAYAFIFSKTIMDYFCRGFMLAAIIMLSHIEVSQEKWILYALFAGVFAIGICIGTVIAFRLRT